MENDLIKNIWNSQSESLQLSDPLSIMKLAKSQRRNQWIGIIIMTFTVLILIYYSIFVSYYQWDNFSLGLILMISTLVVRTLIEVNSIFKKEKELISLNSNDYRNYLNRHYKRRLWINYYLTPVCIIFYAYGFYILLPFFKNEFSNGFYSYILYSGFISIGVITGIILNRINQERKALKYLKGTSK